MRSHKGMRPQDVPILLKIIAKENQSWQNKDLATELYISSSEITESLNRSLIAGLLNTEKRKVHKISLLEFIRYGLRFVFPAIPAIIVNGIPTAHSHPFMQQYFKSETTFVWPYLTGEIRGQSIEPLYKGIPRAALHDEKLYKLLALVDVMRVGRTRECKIAFQELEKMFKNES